MSWDLGEYVRWDGDQGLKIGYSRYISPNFTDQDMKEFSRFPQLVRLGIWGTNISDLGLKHLVHLSGLKWLELAYGGNGSGLASLAALPELESLKLGYCHVPIEALAALRHLSRLRYLSFLHCQIDHAVLKEMGTLIEVEQMGFHLCSMDDQALASLTLPRLSVLVLSQGLYPAYERCFTDSGLAVLKIPESLRELYLPAWSASPITKSGVQSILTKFPNVTIYQDVNEPPGWASDPEEVDS